MNEIAYFFCFVRFDSISLKLSHTSRDARGISFRILFVRIIILRSAHITHQNTNIQRAISAVSYNYNIYWFIWIWHVGSAHPNNRSSTYRPLSPLYLSLFLFLSHSDFGLHHLTSKAIAVQITIMQWVPDLGWSKVRSKLSSRRPARAHTDINENRLWLCFDVKTVTSDLENQINTAECKRKYEKKKIKVVRLSVCEHSRCV